MIRILLTETDPKRVAAVQAMADHECLYNPNLSGASIEVSGGEDFECVQGADEIVGSVLLAQVRNVLDAEDNREETTVSYEVLCRMADSALVTTQELQDAADAAYEAGLITRSQAEAIDRRIEASEEEAS